MTVYKCNIYEIKKYSQLRVILVFKIELVSGCFFICYINTTNVIVVKLDDVRTRNKCFVCWTFCLSHYVIPHWYYQNLLSEGRQACCCTICSKWSLKNNGNQFHPTTFSYLLSISALDFNLTALFPWSKFHLQKIYSLMLGC